VVWLRSSLICVRACRFLDDGLRREGGGVEGGDSVDYDYVEIYWVMLRSCYCWHTMSVQMDFSKSSTGCFLNHEQPIVWDLLWAYRSDVVFGSGFRFVDI